MKVTALDHGIARALADMHGALSDLRPLMKKLGARAEQNVHLRFDTKSDPSGSKWAPWSEATKEAREAEGRGTLLEYTGRMRDSLTYIADEKSVEVGFAVPYAEYHEMGWGVPQRQMLFDGFSLSRDDLDEAMDIASKYFERLTKGGKP